MQEGGGTDGPSGASGNAHEESTTKEHGSSWIFERFLTWANALRRVQCSVFSLVTAAEYQQTFDQLVGQELQLRVVDGFERV
jgi:hypothetical protein